MNAKEIYKDDIDDDYFHIYNYQPMIDAIGNPIIQVDDKDYQGDSRVIFDVNGKYGYLNFGWGSCSGCDALQGCVNIDQVQELCNEIENCVMWFDSKDDLIKYFKEKDWQLEYSWHAQEHKEFIDKVINWKLDKEEQ